MKNLKITVNGVAYDVQVEETNGAAVPAAPAEAPAPAPAAAPAPAVSGEGEKIEAPLNGTVLSVNVAVGAAVKSGETLCVLEAMKMENEIVAPRDGKITSVAAQKGATVAPGDVLFTLA